MYSGWNYLDMIVLAVGYIGKVGDPDGPLKALRLVRAFRPLRMVNRVAGMKLVIGAIVSACPALANVCALLVAVFLIFAILGLSLFKGKFFSCNDGDVMGKSTCTGHFAGDFAIPRVWANPSLGGFSSQNFDNIYMSFLVLFEVATGDSWESVLYLIADIPAKDYEQPVLDQSRWYGMYLIIFVFVGQLFMLQLFVSVIIDSFNFADGCGLQTGDQEFYCNMVTLLGMLEPEPKPEPIYESPYRTTAYNMFMSCDPLPAPGLDEVIASGQLFDLMAVNDLENKRLELKAMQALPDDFEEHAIADLEKEIAELAVQDEFLRQFSVESMNNQPRPAGLDYSMGASFDNTITICICISIGFMCTIHFEQSSTWDKIQKYQNYFFLSIFVFEMTLKHIGLGFRQYWTSPFDAFDGVVVLISVFFLFVDGGAIAGLFRIGRVFRLIKRAPALRALMTALISIVPTVSNVFTVLLLVFFFLLLLGYSCFLPVDLACR